MEKMYPNLEIETTDGINVTSQFMKNLSDARIKEIQGKRHELEMNLKHYKKILKRWKTIGNVLKITSIIIVGGCALGTMILGFGAMLVPITVLGALAAIGGAEGIITESLLLGLVKQKKEKFKEKIEHIQEYLSKSWFLFEKIREDSVISLEEINEFRKLLECYEKGLTVDDNEEKEFVKLRESLKQKAVKEAKNEVKEDLKKEMKEEIKAKYLHK